MNVHEATFTITKFEARAIIAAIDSCPPGTLVGMDLGYSQNVKYQLNKIFNEGE